MCAHDFPVYGHAKTGARPGSVGRRLADVGVAWTTRTVSVSVADQLAAVEFVTAPHTGLAGGGREFRALPADGAAGADSARVVEVLRRVREPRIVVRVTLAGRLLPALRIRDREQ